MENQSILKKLYPKLVSGKITEQELLWLKAYFDTGDPKDMYALIRSELNITEETAEPSQEESKILTRVYGYVAGEKFKDEEPIRLQLSKITLWPRIAIAAAVTIMIIGAGLFYFFENPTHTSVDQMVYQDDVAPGGSGATLTLANGEKIRLSDAVNGKLAEQAGVVISKWADGQLVYEIKGDTENADQMNTLSTAKGETYRIRLPDGSVVWLNAASSLTYSTNLVRNGIRKARLTGEGYFEIAKDTAHPFIIESLGQEVEVLGTEFNISSYPEQQQVKTTLLEGRIKIADPLGSTILSPGFQAVVDDKGIRVSEVNTDLVVAWKNNNFTFDLLPITEIMPMIARWYNVEVVYIGQPSEEKFWGSVSRFENVSKVLEALEATGNVRFKIEGRRILVTK